MQEMTAPVLTAWESYYVIVGSSGAALTGLMFVVITLVNDSQRRRSERAVATYTTPTILHFGAALLVSAVISAPGRMLWPVGLTIGLLGAAGMAYIAIVVHRMTKIAEYKAVFEDWLFHVILPAIAYLCFLIGAIALVRYPETSLFVVAGATLLLLYIGIHNAWDTVTFLVLGPGPATSTEEPKAPAA